MGSWTVCRSCGERFDFEERVTIRAHDGAWYNCCSYDCVLAVLVRNFAGNLNLTPDEIGWLQERT